MNNFNPYLNTLNMSRNISPFQVAGSSFVNNATTRGLFSRIGASKVTLSGILNGAQKTIGTVNQIIPLYNQVKPMFQNSKILLNVARGLKGDTTRNKFNQRNRPMNYDNTINVTPINKEENKIKEEPTNDSPSKPYFI